MTHTMEAIIKKYNKLIEIKQTLTTSLKGVRVAGVEDTAFNKIYLDLNSLLDRVTKMADRLERFDEVQTIMAQKAKSFIIISKNISSR